MKYLFFLFLFSSSHVSKILPYNLKSKIDIEEPSDIYYNAVSSEYIVVSDEGTIKVFDANMNIIKTLRYQGSDFEAVTVVDSSMYVSDESGKKILQFSLNTYDLLATYDIHNFSALNEGIEGITFDDKHQKVIASLEKDPVALLILDANFNQVKRINMPMFSDISALSFYDGYLYVLSDEDASLSKVDPVSFKVISTVYLNIINPEGITFINKDTFIIVSDAEQKMFTFNSSTL